MIEIEYLMLHIGKTPGLQARFEGDSGPMIEGGVVDHEHLALRAHHVAGKLAVIAISGQHIGHAHSRLDSGETQYLRRMVQWVAFEVGIAAPRVRDRCVVSIRRSRRSSRQTQRSRTAATTIPPNAEPVICESFQRPSNAGQTSLI